MYKVTKIAENVEVVPTKDMTDINGKFFTIYDEGKKESFSSARVTSQLTEIDKQILYWQNFDEKAYKKAMQDKAQARKVLLLEVKVEMEK